ncbi:MAG: glycerol-3-phosphate dehydrogenase/oxidase [Aggregatilineales bacterium]
MWERNWREIIWSQINQEWDVLVIGGGITGAGILREAARAGLRALLVEQRDFAWGTSSRSSKLVHGGLRYLASGQVRMTWTSVREREQLLNCAPGLVEPLGFLLATERSSKPGRLAYSAGLSLYDLMAGQWTHRRYQAEDFRMLAPRIRSDRLAGGFGYNDAQTDDARLVLRLLHEAAASGGQALNYARADELLLENGRVAGARLRDQIHDRTADVRARAVINATGAWADCLRGQLRLPARVRPLRGSHLILPSWRLPVAQAVAFPHPLDRRPVFVLPWEGVTLVGTTDLDHDQPLNAEPRISPEEVAYLLAAVAHQFPGSAVTTEDIISTFAGVRPVIGTGKEDPSRESREHVIWHENGLLTVTGGKLTTFRATALQALREIIQQFPQASLVDSAPPLTPAPAQLTGGERLSYAARRRLLGRYGANAPALVAAAQPGELETVPGTQTLWAELRWAARAEGVCHLDDLLLRRVRLGLLLPEGGAALLPRIKGICQDELGWDNARWETEAAAYLALWRAHYSVPDPALVPDWHSLLSASERRATLASRPRRAIWLLAAAAGLVLMCWRWRRSKATHAVAVSGAENTANSTGDAPAGCAHSAVSGAARGYPALRP